MRPADVCAVSVLCPFIHQRSSLFLYLHSHHCKLCIVLLQGTYTYASGNVYEGDWVQGKKHGHGTYTTINGDKYEGGYVANKKSGEGKFVSQYGKEEEEGGQVSIAELYGCIAVLTVER